MSDYTDLQNQIQKTEEIIRERDMAAAYLRITDEMGPCPQLLAFVNYDNTMVDDDGTALESMNIFDQHNLLVSKLNLDALDFMATENIGHTFLKWSGVLNVITGVASLATIGPLAVPTILVGGLMIKAGRDKEKTPPVTDFTRVTADYNTAYKNLSAFANALPSTLEAGAWASFDKSFTKSSLANKALTYLASNIGKEIDVVKEHGLFNEDIPFTKSGWTVDSFKNATHWAVDNGKKLEAAVKTIETKTAALNKLISKEKSLDPKTSKNIAAAMAVSSKSASFATKKLKDVKTLLGKIAPNFEEKK